MMLPLTTWRTTYHNTQTSCITHVTWCVPRILTRNGVDLHMLKECAQLVRFSQKNALHLCSRMHDFYKWFLLWSLLDFFKGGDNQARIATVPMNYHLPPFLWTLQWFISISVFTCNTLRTRNQLWSYQVHTNNFAPTKPQWTVHLRKSERVTYLHDRFDGF